MREEQKTKRCVWKRLGEPSMLSKTLGFMQVARSARQGAWALSTTDWRLRGKGAGASLARWHRHSAPTGFWLLFFWFVCFFKDQVTFSVLGWVVTWPLGGDGALP